MNIFFMSRPGRELMNEFGLVEWDTAFHFENALLTHKPELIRAHILSRLTGMWDDELVAHLLRELKGTQDLAPVRETFELFCGNFLVQDYSIIDLRKIADMCVHYPFSVVEPTAARCRAQGKYTIQYIAAALTNEAGDDIVALRRELRLEEIQRKGKPTPLPPNRASKYLINVDPAVEAEAAEIDRRLARQWCHE